MVLFLDAGTAVLLLLASDADLLFEAVLFDAGRRWRKSCLSGERRVLTYPSGLGDFDLDLLVDVLGLGSGLRLPVGGREDAEWDRDAGFKVQVAGLGAREAVFEEKIPLANFLERSR